MARSVDAARNALLRSISEADFQAVVVRKAELWGWWVWHDFSTQGRNQRGLPDLILVRPPRVLFVELKKQKGRVTPEQQGVLDMLARCPGVEVALWRPSDDAEIDAVLAPV